MTQGITNKDQITSLEEQQIIVNALEKLMGERGDDIAKSIISNGFCAEYYWKIILDSIKHNNKESIVKHLGLIGYYYLKIR